LGSFLPDLLVIDPLIPDADGVAIVRHALATERYAETRIVVLSALPPADARLEELRGLGVDAVLFQPIADAELADAIGARRTSSQPAADARQTMPWPPVIDPEVMWQALGDDPGAIAEVVAVYRESLPADLAPLAAALERGELPEVAELAHRIKGAAANLGAERMCRLAAAVETAARARDLAATRNQAAQLDAELARLLEALDGSPWRG
jgi:two-component system sensor histidine kinase EvgS